MKDLKLIQQELREIMLESVIDTFNALKKELIVENETYESVLLMESQWRELERESMRGTVGQNELMIGRNRVRQNLIDLINDLEENDLLISQIKEEPTKEENETTEQKEKVTDDTNQFRRTFLIILGVAALIILAIVLSTNSGKEEDEEDILDPISTDTLVSCYDTTAGFLQQYSNGQLAFLITAQDSSYVLGLNNDTLQLISKEQMLDSLVSTFWTIQVDTNGTGSLKALNREIYLTVDSNTNVYLDSTLAAESSNWLFKANDNNEYQIISQLNDQCLFFNQDAAALQLGCCDSLDVNAINS
ncbi:MAG: hypothetical protein AAFO07_27080, partial [Bacteroidota bacterium]